MKFSVAQGAGDDHDNAGHHQHFAQRRLRSETRELPTPWASCMIACAPLDGLEGTHPCGEPRQRASACTPQRCAPFIFPWGRGSSAEVRGLSLPACGIRRLLRNVSAHVRMHVRKYVCCAHMYARPLMTVRARVRALVCVCSHIHTCMHMYVCTCMHPYAYTCACRCVCTYTCTT